MEGYLLVAASRNRTILLYDRASCSSVHSTPYYSYPTPFDYWNRPRLDSSTKMGLFGAIDTSCGCSNLGYTCNYQYSFSDHSSNSSQLLVHLS